MQKKTGLAFKAHRLRNQFRMYWQICLLILPALAILIYFKYYPMYGVQIAFRDYKMNLGIWGSKWIGLDIFHKLFKTKAFLQAFRNTVILNLYSLVFAFPLSILFGVMLNECRWNGYKRVVQTVTYLPHFLSWVIVYALFNNMLQLNTGIVNRIISLFGHEQIIFLQSTKYFRSIIVISEIWKNTGWNTIVILAGITAVDPALNEAALIDGASRFQRVLYVTLPCIRSTIVVLLILKLGALMQNDITQIMMFYNSTTYEVGDVIGTYIYRQGIGKMSFSLTTAAGLIQSCIGMVLILITNTLAHKMGETGLW